MNHILYCKKCSEVILKSTEAESKVRGKLLIFKQNKAFIVCKGCNSEVPVPITLQVSELKSENLSLYIEKGLTRKKY